MINRRRHRLACIVLLWATVMPGGGAWAQTSLRDIPGYASYRAVQQASRELAVQGRVAGITWSDDGRFVTFRRGDERLRFDLEQQSLAAAPAGDDTADSSVSSRRARGAQPARGRQRDVEPSPNGRWVARSRDWNVTITDSVDNRTITVTHDGWRKFRYGTASWVYGEELDQRSAMWWSPDSTKLAFYEFDERDVPDHYLVTGWTDLHTNVEVEGFPKPGEPNPVPALIVYDIETGEQRRIDALTEPGQYIYRVAFTAAGDELLFSRTNRRQNTLEIVAADVATGTLRTVLRERQDTWQNNRPTMVFLNDGHRFIWETERTGIAQYELRDLAGNQLAVLSDGSGPVQRIELLDEQRGELWYTAFDAEHPLNAHVFRVRLDGSARQQLTNWTANCTMLDVSPDGEWFIATFETIETPATTVLCDRGGAIVAELASVDQAVVDAAPLTLPELFSFAADDGKTTLYGVLYKPAEFDPAHRYPLLIDVYGGPFSQAVTNRFRGGQGLCEFGFLVAEIDNRGTVNRGKAFESATYLKLGAVDLGDQVAGVRALLERPYVDGQRVGIAGHSYGGFMAALAILKFPQVFHVAVAGSPVTDWRQYDSIYTERYMRTPQDNETGYVAGSCMTFADQLQGRLLLQHGLIDNNVHPNNTFALAKAIREAGGTVDVSIYPERGHNLGMLAFAERIGYLRTHLLAPVVDIPDGTPAETDVVY